MISRSWRSDGTATLTVMITHVHTFFNDCCRSGRQARAVESVSTWFESRERRLFDLLRFEGGMTTENQVFLKICCRRHRARIVA